MQISASPRKQEKNSRKIGKCPPNPIFEQFSDFSADFFLYLLGQAECCIFPFFLPISQALKKKKPKPKLLSPDIFQWGGGLPRERVGAKKFGMSLETRGIKLFCRDIPGFCRDILEAPENRHRVNGVGRGGGQAFFNQILTRFHKIRLKSG